MKINKLIYKNLLLTIVLIFVTGIPLTVQADGDQHHKRHAYHFDRHDRAYTQPRHQYKRLNHKHSWKNRHNKRHQIYNQSHGYYKHFYRNHNKWYQQPNTRYHYGRNYSHNHYSTPFYAPPAQVVFGLNTANAQIMLRY